MEDIMQTLMFCKKCGRIVLNTLSDELHYCDCCKAITYPVPEEYLDESLPFMLKNDEDETEQRLYNELVKTSPEFDQQRFDNRDKILSQKNAEYNRVMSIGKAIQNGANPKEALKGNFNVAKCPSCGSTNISKIGLVNRAVSVGVFGLASGKIGKTHKCNSCGTTW